MASSAQSSKARVNVVINVFLVVSAIAIALAWRRARDPHRLWAKRIDENHARIIDTALRGCFGGTGSVEIRAVADGVRGGRVAPPFSECHRGPMAELLVAPNSFVQSIQNPPIEVYRLRERERTALMRLMAAARPLEQQVSRAAGHPADDQREPLAARIEDLAIAAQNEHDAYSDLVRAARDAASLF